MERLTDKKEADVQRRKYEIRLKQGYPRNIPEERFLRLAAYEDTGLEPEDFKKAFNEDSLLKLTGQLLGVTPDRLRELAQADKEEANMDQKVQLHKKICNELTALFEQKNHDYGDSFHQTYLEEGWPMVRIRLSDKLNRVKALTRGDSQQVQDESLRDTLLDLANYAILAVMEMDRRERDESGSDTLRRV